MNDEIEYEFDIPEVTAEDPVVSQVSKPRIELPDEELESLNSFQLQQYYNALEAQRKLGERLERNEKFILDNLMENGHFFNTLNDIFPKAFKRGNKYFIVTGKIKKGVYEMREVTNYMKLNKYPKREAA